MLDMANPAQVALLDRLRALRLWHWKVAMHLRKEQRALEELIATRSGRNTAVKECIARYNKEAGFHLTQVQTLNEFFAIGDTAERDENETDD